MSNSKEQAGDLPFTAWERWVLLTPTRSGEVIILDRDGVRAGMSTASTAPRRS